MVLLMCWDNCVNSLQRNQPAGYESETGTVNHKPDLLSCEISLCIYVPIWQMNYCCLSVYDFVWRSVSHLTLACTNVGGLKEYS